ncbi:hypothetical protein Cabys_1419 [Caldithrix abyssi DSM 13497]|uniref:Uncharacterized protein n=1 Tax=Caldithrix abyssi DSM 13497 TaxID=880073 RepID=A0A1J1C8C1_CALAY|nr:hypothetical protein Cabys_1419 [Caldithrix abyssi DSM 13497]
MARLFISILHFFYKFYSFMCYLYFSNFSLKNKEKEGRP